MGIRHHPLYATWSNIKSRTTNPNVRSYKDYGARGIRMCDEWLTSSSAFIAWIEENLGPRPEGRTLDRIDNDRGYEPGNLRWSTVSEQNHHRRPEWPTRRGSVDCPHGRYRARIRVGARRRVHLGSFSTEAEAWQAISDFLL